MLTFRAYAKINLGLLVREKRPDGYHNIETVFHRINLFDDISFRSSNEVLVESSSAEAPGGESNICFKAARILRDHLRIHQGVTISLQKNIPVGAGLGGGSSDAATVLRHLPSFWGANVAESVLFSFALQLGSDVPFFLTQGIAYARGRGEILEPLRLDIPYFILLCNPRIHVPTAWAYQQVKIREVEKGYDLKKLLADGMARPEVLRLVRNDFETPVFEVYPEVEQTKQMMMECGALFALMSGSGSSVYGLFSSRHGAETAEGMFRSRGHFVSLTAPRFQAL